MALSRKFIEGGDVSSELYADTFADVSDEECESESVNSDVAITSIGTRTCLSVFTSDREVL
jgi:hypothetical protein